MNNQRTDGTDFPVVPNWRQLSRNPHDKRMTRDEVAAEVTWLLGTDSPLSIAHRLGYQDIDGLRLALHRGGRSDLAARVAPLSMNPTKAGDQMGRSTIYDLSCRAAYARRTAAA